MVRHFETLLKTLLRCALFLADRGVFPRERLSPPLIVLAHARLCRLPFLLHAAFRTLSRLPLSLGAHRLAKTEAILSSIYLA